MRWIKRLLTITLIGIVLIAVLALGYTAVDKSDSFFVQQAELKDSHLFEHERARMEAGEEIEFDEILYRVIGHQLKKGSGTILGYRWYSNGSAGIIDDELYRKLTVWIPERFANKPGLLQINSDTGIVAIYSSGASAWPRSGCHGQIQSGSLHLEWGARQLKAKIEGVISYISDPLWKDQACTPPVIQEEYTFDRLEFEELTPWLGLPGKHIYDETYRK